MLKCCSYHFVNFASSLRSDNEEVSEENLLGTVVLPSVWSCDSLDISNIVFMKEEGFKIKETYFTHICPQVFKKDERIFKMSFY